MRVSIQTTINNRQEIETHYRQMNDDDRHQQIEKPPNQKMMLPSSSINYNDESRITFKSVLTQPFGLWNEIEDIVGEFLNDWSHSQRSCVIKNLIRFLELKVIMEEYTSNGLLSPTLVVAHVWHVLILETELYRDVIYAIQDFHARPHRVIHHALVRRYDTDEYLGQQERTQRLFRTYYGCIMPTDLKMRKDRRQEKARETPEDTSLPTSVRIDSSSVVRDSYDDDYDSYKNERKPWYYPWLPNCDCFSVFDEGLCGKNQPTCPVDEDFYAREEIISLLTTPPEVFAE
mmetsp:Transcript_49469/g.55977  ORF Transcript_49469/g.55977 Transcript_49469/m.55977 type:complete len:288 (+) Transcript_49469:20-883(+)